MALRLYTLQATKFCLQRAGLNQLADVNFIGYSFKPKERLDKNYHYQHGYLPTPGDFGTLVGEELFYQGNLQVEKQSHVQVLAEQVVQVI